MVSSSKVIADRPASGGASFFNSRIASTVFLSTCRFRITEPRVLLDSLFTALSRSSGSTVSSVSRNSAASGTRRGSALTIYAVALIASTLPCESLIVPRRAVTTPSFVHWLTPRRVSSSASSTVSCTRRAATAPKSRISTMHISSILLRTSSSGRMSFLPVTPGSLFADCLYSPNRRLTSQSPVSAVFSCRNHVPSGTPYRGLLRHACRVAQQDTVHHTCC